MPQVFRALGGCGAVLALLFSVVLMAQQSQHELFERARLLEDSNQDLAEAISLYGQVVDQTSGERALAATAQLRVGLVYERLGRSSDAQRAFEVVVGEYADQAESAAQAGARLAALAAAPSAVAVGEESQGSALTLRLIYEGPGLDGVNGLSDDGRYLTFVDWGYVGDRGGELAIVDLTTGQERVVTDSNRDAHSGTATFAAFSPDGERVAYQWLNEEDLTGVMELRIVSVDGGAPRVLYRNEEVSPFPADWSPDGEQILVKLNQKDETTRIALVAVADGTTRVLKSFNWLRVGNNMAFSPDGRHIVYDVRLEDGQRDIFLLARDGSREVRVTDHPANDAVLGWTPDGRQLLFQSDRLGPWGAWAVSVADGHTQGSPVLIKQDLGDIYPFGVSERGDVFYSSWTRLDQVYTVSLNADNGERGVEPVDESLMTANGGPGWSPDGRHLAYRTESHTSPRPFISVLSPSTGDVRTVQPELTRIHPAHGLQWSPDGRSLLVIGSDGQRGYRWGVYQVNVDTAAVTPVVLNGRERYIHQVQWLRDGRAIVYASQTQIVVRDLDSGQERELVRMRPPLSSTRIAMSGDGRHLAYTVTGEANRELVRVVPIAGGESRELHRAAEGEWIASIRWTPDGDHLILMKTPPTGPPSGELWRVPLDGGPAEQTGPTIDGFMRVISLHPDGEQVAIAVGVGRAELWAMENVSSVLDREP